MRNDRTGEIREVKVGFSWVLLLFSGFFGLPLFLRRLNEWGGAMCVFSMVQILSLYAPTEKVLWSADIAALISIGAAIYLAFKGNELTAKNLLQNGWSFEDEDDYFTTQARQKWSFDAP